MRKVIELNDNQAHILSFVIPHYNHRYLCSTYIASIYPDIGHMLTGTTSAVMMVSPPDNESPDRRGSYTKKRTMVHG